MRSWLLAIGLVLPGGFMCVAIYLIARHVRRYQQWKAQSYPQQIATLAPDRPMVLPAVRPLKAQRSGHSDRVLRFHERMEEHG